jgi:hypothetical protein
LEGSPSSFLFLILQTVLGLSKRLEPSLIYPTAGRAWIQFRPNDIIGSNKRIDSDVNASRNLSWQKDEAHGPEFSRDYSDSFRYSSGRLLISSDIFIFVFRTGKIEIFSG